MSLPGSLYVYVAYHIQKCGLTQACMPHTNVTCFGAYRSMRAITSLPADLRLPRHVPAVAQMHHTNEQDFRCRCLIYGPHAMNSERRDCNP